MTSRSNPRPRPSAWEAVGVNVNPLRNKGKRALLENRKGQKRSQQTARDQFRLAVLWPLSVQQASVLRSATWPEGLRRTGTALTLERDTEVTPLPVPLSPEKAP